MYINMTSFTNFFPQINILNDFSFSCDIARLFFSGQKMLGCQFSKEKYRQTSFTYVNIYWLSLLVADVKLYPYYIILSVLKWFRSVLTVLYGSKTWKYKFRNEYTSPWLAQKAESSLSNFSINSNWLIISKFWLDGFWSSFQLKLLFECHKIIENATLFLNGSFW